MEKQIQQNIERTSVTTLKLTADDIIAALKKGNARLFKDASVKVTPISTMDEHAPIMEITITQTTRKAK